MQEISIHNLVSIINPTYNCGPYIAHAIEFVRNQTFIMGNNHRR